MMSLNIYVRMTSPDRALVLNGFCLLYFPLLPRALRRGLSLGHVYHGAHYRWNGLLIRSIKLSPRRLRITIFEGFELTTFTPVPSKKLHSRCYAQGNKDKPGSPPKIIDKNKKSFKLGLEVPKYWSNMLSIDEAIVNRLWQGAADTSYRVDSYPMLCF